MTDKRLEECLDLLRWVPTDGRKPDDPTAVVAAFGEIETELRRLRATVALIRTLVPEERKEIHVHVSGGGHTEQISQIRAWFTVNGRKYTSGGAGGAG